MIKQTAETYFCVVLLEAHHGQVGRFNSLQHLLQNTADEQHRGISTTFDTHQATEKVRGSTVAEYSTVRPRTDPPLSQAQKCIRPAGKFWRPKRFAKVALTCPGSSPRHLFKKAPRENSSKAREPLFIRTRTYSSRRRDKRTSPICTNPMSSFARHTTNVSRFGSCTIFSSLLVLVKDRKLEGICAPNSRGKRDGGQGVQKKQKKFEGSD